MGSCLIETGTIRQAYSDSSSSSLLLLLQTAEICDRDARGDRGLLLKWQAPYPKTLIPIQTPIGLRKAWGISPGWATMLKGQAVKGGGGGLGGGGGGLEGAGGGGLYQQTLVSELRL